MAKTLTLDERLERVIVALDKLTGDAGERKAENRALDERLLLLVKDSENVRLATEGLTSDAEERKREFDRSMAESRAEWEKRMAETDKRLKKLAKLVGDVGNNAGFHAEQFFQDALGKTLTFGGEKYDYMLPNVPYIATGGGIGDFDIVLFNCKSIAIIEVKNRIHPDFIKELAEERLAKFRKYFSRYNDCKVYLGIAGFSFCQQVLEDAKKYGIGIIKQVGKSIEIEADHLKAY